MERDGTMTGSGVAMTAQGKKNRKVSLLTRFWGWEASGVLVALTVLVLALSLAADNFLSAYNVSIVVRQAAFVGLVALGQTLVLLVGGIDLSVGAGDRKSTRLNSSHPRLSRMPSSA